MSALNPGRCSWTNYSGRGCRNRASWIALWGDNHEWEICTQHLNAYRENFHDIRKVTA